MASRIRGGSSSDDGDETVNVCPVCFTNRFVVKSLDIRFTTCCGAAMCSECVRLLYNRVSNSPCRGCGLSIKKVDYVADNAIQQLFSRARLVRIRVTGVLEALRSEFKTLTEYNDHLEKCETIVDGLLSKEDGVSGTAETELKNSSKSLKERRAKAAGGWLDTWDEQRSMEEAMALF